ncbi:Imm10 family immunity protein [Burkholderia plantarii]|uniref:Imm10 family immunity protein n=1 Tax=Burkholderia plantarii TaxID=41899 RepID=UPI0007056A9A|nr:Imm10 family immunity protein [Burkholderia plantarii]ALK32992.1 hypothetical protein bpln_2g07380 [Burkholderia plantarii]GLZ20420.1 hypothetical protein Bpla01_39490 [Burkholderia plantarii]
MRFEFSASEVNYTFEDTVHILGFAADPATDYVILQRPTEVDEQDKSLGQDTYYVEVCADGVSGYGGIKSVLLKDRTLDIDLNEGVSWRDDLSAIRIHLSGDLSLGELERWLTFIFGNTSTTVSIA